MRASNSINRSVGWSVGRSVGWSVGRSVGWSVGRSVGRSLIAKTSQIGTVRLFHCGF